MICVMKKDSTRQVNAAVPSSLIDEFDVIVDRLGIAKQRLVAAAIASFVHATEEEQFQMYLEMHKVYYADTGSLSGQEADTGATRGSGQGTKSRSRRRDAG